MSKLQQLKPRGLLLLVLMFCPLASADWQTDLALLKDMVKLDKAFIPALLTSRAGDHSEI